MHCAPLCPFAQESRDQSSGHRLGPRTGPLSFGPKFPTTINFGPRARPNKIRTEILDHRTISSRYSYLVR